MVIGFQISIQFLRLFALIDVIYSQRVLKTSLQQTAAKTCETMVVEIEVEMILTVYLQLSGLSTNQNNNFWVNTRPSSTKMFLHHRNYGTYIVEGVNSVTNEKKPPLHL